MNRISRHLFVPGILALIATTGAACEIFTSVDRTTIGGSGGSGGSGSTGTGTTNSSTTGVSTTVSSTSSTSSTSSAGGAGGATTSTGAGGSGGAGGEATSTGTSTATSTSSASSSSSGGGCTVATDCPMPAKPCVMRLCTAGVCSTGNIPADTPTAAQVAGDCKQKVCDGTGDALTVDDDTDVPTDNEVCTVDSCSGGAPVHAPAATGLDCTAQGPSPKHLCGAATGAAAGKCVECNTNADCTGGKTCTMNMCQ